MAHNEYNIKLVKGGTISGDDKSTNAPLPSTETFVSYGGSSDLWGLTWTHSDINSSDFGAVFSVISSNTGTNSNYIKATNFGFSIPAGATINGIELEVEQKVTNSETSSATTNVDLMRIAVYYTGINSITGVQTMTGIQSITM